MNILSYLKIFLLLLGTLGGLSVSAQYRQSNFGDRVLIDFPEDSQLAREHELDRSNFYDPEEDYASFEGRVTDRDRDSSILKIQSEEKNVKFFRAGDPINFQVAHGQKGMCRGHVRDVEPGYIIIFIKDLTPCWQHEEDYFRRGTALLIESPRLSERIREASRYRHTLLKRREDFFNQLNQVNHFLWSFNQQKVIVSAEYDKKIEELRQKKQEAINALMAKKADQTQIQRELITRLDELDRDLEFYRVESAPGKDRWALDQHTGLPVQRRPQDMKPDTRSDHSRALESHNRR